ncbi:MAG: AbrB family transcriptional regulator [Synergistaceae bacterium]|jgi:membrane AbrB-like protein|nr:AbrB family transcriptional regulator [Synergistaceae bacterium]
MEVPAVDEFFAFCLVYALGSVGFVVFKFLRIPNPALLGSMFATGALNIAGYYPRLSTRLISFIANAMIGVMIARQIDGTVLRHMRTLFRSVLIQTIGMLALSLACGGAMYAICGTAAGGKISLSTALISGAAGGITEMTVFGMSVNADVAVIALIQLFRVVTALTLIPYLSIIGEKMGGRKKNKTSSDRALPKFSRGDYALLALCSMTGAVIGFWLKVPTGTMLGAMIASGAVAISINKRYGFDVKLRYIAQIGLGLAMGQRISPDFTALLGSLLIPALIITALMLVGSTLLAILLYKTTDFDLTTCLLCSAPAGLSQIGAFAEEIGADPFTASVFHTARIVGIVTIYPWIVLPLIS